MAKEFSQDAVLDFLCQSNGKVRNTNLVAHFRAFLKDPERERQHREQFKKFVNSLAVVKKEEGVCYVVLRSRYQEFLGEDLGPPLAAQHEDPVEEEVIEGERQTRVYGEPGEVASFGAPSSWPIEQAGIDAHSPEDQRRKKPKQRIRCERGDAEVCRQVSTSDCGSNKAKRSKSSKKKRSVSDKRASGAEGGGNPFDSGDPERELGASDPYPPPIGRKVVHNPIPENENHDRALHNAELHTNKHNADEPRQLGDANGSKGCDAHYPGFEMSESAKSLQKRKNKINRCDFERIKTLSDDDTVGKNWAEQSTCPPECAPLKSLSCHSSPPSLELMAPQNRGLPTHQLPHELYTINESISEETVPVFKSIRSQIPLQESLRFFEKEEQLISCSPSDRNAEIYHDRGQSEKNIGCYSRNSTERTLKERLHAFKAQISPWSDQKSNGRHSDGIKVQASPLRVKESNDTTLFPMITETYIHYKRKPVNQKIIPEYKEATNVILLKMNEYSPGDHISDKEYMGHRKTSVQTNMVEDIPLVVPPGISRPLTSPSVEDTRFEHVHNSPPSHLQIATGGVLEMDFSPPNERSPHTAPVVPLHHKEHEWMITLATGSWDQARDLFMEDPNLATKKDFISGFTSLHWISKHGDYNMLHTFFSGANKAGIKLDTNTKSKCGYTPLHIAVIHGHQRVIKLLVQRFKANVDLRDTSGKKPWHYLSTKMPSELWQLLGAPKSKIINSANSAASKNVLVAQEKTSTYHSPKIRRKKSSLATMLKPQLYQWKANHQFDNL
ncbi:ankyrin repeat domain-containing protein SOWAHB [Latimeria chalumnae]|uniref:ankyrin repeat domain-containing protein SOWAHB n=1 Tax=Latimeria chalumnae TaxID=7897 RepID=UPI0003C19229|nr:PREDICTED: ankyrin repeat domain-containing protein SOWAHB [Latimeria chalumnae]|eukprot:XP_006013207.1 PREDICTED: ankyrin repeat domain-containing protein SOWAHB [Latimeria chalumnae]